MKKVIFKILLITFSLHLSAQDKIYFLSKQRIEAVILSCDSGMVRYKKYDNPGGPVYTVMKKDIAVIEYANGNYAIYKRKTTLGFSYDTVYTKTNIISVNMLSRLNNGWGISYEKIFARGMMGLRVPFSFINFDKSGFAAVPSVGFAYYPKGQEKYSLCLSADYFMSIPYRYSGLALNIGLRANWSQRVALSLELGGNILFEDHKIYGLLFPGIHTPAFNLTHRF